MGKGGQQSADSEKEITWEEIKRHTDRNDKWLVIDNNVYDITNWSKRHPGGSKVISHFAGEDATEPFEAFHLDKEFVRKFLKSIHIGKISNSKTETKTTEEERNEAMKRDFEELRKVAVKRGLFKPSITFFVLSIFQLILLEIATVYILYNFGYGWGPWLISACLMATLQSQGGWIQHDYGHLSVFKNSRLNHVLQQYVLAFTKGASPAWWNHLHFQHHAKPNVLDKDPDVRLEKLFVLGETMSIRIAKNKFTVPFNWQHRYFFAIGPPLLFPLYFQYMTFNFVITRKKWIDFFVMLIFYAKLAFLYIGLLGGFGSMLAWYLLTRVLESNWFVWVAQSNHIPMEIDEDKQRPWLSAQLHATCDIEKSVFNDWFTGHLNFQIEHHLFPTMPRHNLYKIKPDVEKLCKKHGVPYVTKTLSQAFSDIPKTLKNSGEIWLAHYQMHHH